MYQAIILGNIEMHKISFLPLWKQSYWLQEVRRIRNPPKLRREVVVKKASWRKYDLSRTLKWG